MNRADKIATELVMSMPAGAILSFAIDGKKAKYRVMKIDTASGWIDLKRMTE